jgi:hypothetical protein
MLKSQLDTCVVSSVMESPIRRDSGQTIVVIAKMAMASTVL